jgi:hypothetical protein
MPSPHLDRKLKEALGNDAGTELGAVTDRIDPIRGDIGELRHQFDLQKAELATMRQGIRADINEAFIRQTRWMLGGLALILTAILFKG